jgi:hypothetical protein
MKKRRSRTEKKTTSTPSTLPTLTIHTLLDYAARWQVSRRTITNWLHEGLPHVKTGARSVRIIAVEADEWVRRKWGRVLA